MIKLKNKILKKLKIYNNNWKIKINIFSTK